MFLLGGGSHLRVRPRGSRGVPPYYNYYNNYYNNNSNNYYYFIDDDYYYYDYYYYIININIFIISIITIFIIMICDAKNTGQVKVRRCGATSKFLKWLQLDRAAVELMCDRAAVWSSCCGSSCCVIELLSKMMLYGRAAVDQASLQAFLQACSFRPRVCSPTPGAEKSNILIDCTR